MAANIPGSTPPYVRVLSKFTKYFPNFDFFFVISLRNRGVELLKLNIGDRVIDAGCGSGGSFPYLVRAVGTSGEVVGIEISPTSSICAQRRISANDWGNVSVIESPAQSANLDGSFKGLMMFAAPDVYGSDEALLNIIPNLAPDARMVAFGAKLSTKGFGKLMSPLISGLCRLSFSTTPQPDLEPWKVIEKYLDNVIVEEHFFGLMFIVSGQLKEPKER